ncbi:MAG: hypothetical protein M1829_001881 [Trizodia sp. TS-e1964]|nr:MAG: hypothetical protein M1829_001881 [Trizodia sp. TS-e1964]
MAERDGCVSDWGSYISPSATEFAAPLKGCGLFRVGLLKKRVVIVNYSEYMKKAVESRTERDLRYCKLEAGVFFDCSSPTMPADSGFNHELLSPSPNSREVRRIRLYNNLFLMKSNRFGLFHEPGQKDPVLISIPENQGMYDLFCLPLDSIVPPPKLGAIRTHLNGFQSWASRLFA